MSFRRWYDQYPTLSMAVSLLQNTSEANQDWTVDQIMLSLQADARLSEELKLESKRQLAFHLLPERRPHLSRKAWKFVELMKTFPQGVMEDVAFQIIHTLYTLDCKEDVAHLD